MIGCLLGKTRQSDTMFVMKGMIMMGKARRVSDVYRERQDGCTMFVEKDKAIMPCLFGKKLDYSTLSETDISSYDSCGGDRSLIQCSWTKMTRYRVCRGRLYRVVRVL